MKTIRQLLMAMAIMLPLAGMAQAEKSVTLTEPGTLLKAIGDDNLKNIEKLTVAGPVNAQDFATMLKAISEGKLKTLDLLKAEPENKAVPAEAFKYTTSRLRLTRLVLPESLEVIEKYAFTGMSFDEIVFNNELREIKDCAFEKCYFYQKNFTIPGNVIKLDRGAFREVSSYGINFSEGLEIIGVGCFESVHFNDLVLPSTLKFIGSRAFYFPYANCPCSNIDGNVYCKAVTPPASDNNSWAIQHTGNKDYITLYVPKGSLEAYKTSPYWMQFYKFEEFDPSSVINDISTDEVSIKANRSENGELVVEAAPGLEKASKVVIYTLQGHKKIRGTISAGGMLRYELAPGLYIVVCGNQREKVMI